MPHPRRSELFRRIVFFTAAAAAIFLFFKYLIKWIMPFLIAAAAAAIIEPAVSYLNSKLHFKREFASAVCTILFLFVLVGLLAAVLSRIFYEITAFISELPNVIDAVSQLVKSLETKLYNLAGSVSPELKDYFARSVDALLERSSELPALISGKLLPILSSAASATPKTTLFILTSTIGIFFISSSFPEITKFISKQIPEKFKSSSNSFKTDLRSTAGKWLKAQIMLICFTFLELTAGFMLLRIDYAALLALAVALIDALPILGTGTVLIPWAIGCLLLGNTKRGITLLIIYCVITIVRSLLEPKLVGKQLGLNPAATLIAIYSGFCAFGVSGMILFPILLITLKLFNDKGYIKLWK